MQEKSTRTEVVSGPLTGEELNRRRSHEHSAALFPSFPNSVWERTPAKLRFAPPTIPEQQFVSEREPPSRPIRHHVNQPRLPRVIASAGIPPMHRVIDIAAFDRVVVHVFQLLPHHVVVTELLRVTPLLPDLMLAAGLVRLL